jgi:uncharacterized damage-inducible protein DinB
LTQEVPGVRLFLESLEQEYRRYKALAEKTFDAVSAEELAVPLGEDGNSITTLAWHMSGNLKSRFTDFIVTDGEKPWRQRESEFDARTVTHAELRAKWEEGWTVLFDALSKLADADLDREVRIRDEPQSVREALHRSLAHAAYHVGQVVLLGKSFRGAQWTSLSIPRVRK